MSKQPTARQIISEAKAKGYTLTSAGKLNGAAAYKVAGVPAGKKEVNKFALWTASEIGAELLGYPL